MGVCEAFFRPAAMGLMPEVVSEPRLQQANALSSLVMSGSITLGALLAGLLVAAVGPGWGIGIDGLTYLVERLVPAAAAAGGVPRPAAAAAPAASPARALAGEEAAAGDETRPSGSRRRLPRRPRRRLARVHQPHLALGDGRRRRRSSCSPSTGPSRCSGRSSRATSTTARAPGASRRRRWASGRSPAACSACAGGRAGRMLVIAAGMSLAAVPVALLALEAPVWTLYVSLGVMGVEWGLYDPFWMTCMQREVAPDDDLARLELRLPGIAGVLPGGAGAGRAARRRLRRHDGAVGERRRWRSWSACSSSPGATCARRKDMGPRQAARPAAADR